MCRPTPTWRGTWDASVVLSWTPTNIFGATAHAKNAEAHADEVAARKGALKNALRLEVNQAMNALAEATFGVDVVARRPSRRRRELPRAARAVSRRQSHDRRSHRRGDRAHPSSPRSRELARGRAHRTRRTRRTRSAATSAKTVSSSRGPRVRSACRRPRGRPIKYTKLVGELGTGKRPMSHR